jgi:hypothetical protein
MSTPTISSLTPSSGSFIGSQSVIIAGTNLSNAIKVAFGSDVATIVTNTSTSVTCTTPSGTVDTAVDVVVSTIPGSNWTERAYIRNWACVAISSDTGKYQIAIEGINVYTSSNTGETWLQSKTSANNWTAVAISSNGQYQVACMCSGGIYHSSDYGSTWAKRGFPTNASWRSIAISSDGTHITACTDYGTGGVYTSTNSGTSYTQQPMRQSAAWHGVTMSSNGQIQVAVVSDGYTYKSVNYGVDWTEVFTSSGYNWHGISISPDGTILTGGTCNGYIYTSPDTGSTWIQSNSVLSNWLSVSVSSTGYQSAVDGINVYTSSDNGAHWSLSVAPAQNWQSVSISSDGTIQSACVYGGKIYTSNSVSNSKPYTYTQDPPINSPTITSISPISGSTAGGQSMTIIGTNLLNATVTIGGNPVQNLTIVSSIQITCTVPPGTAGATSVIVAVVGATSASKPYTYTQDPTINNPTITSISPISGSTTGGQSMTIIGTNLLNSTVTIGGNPVQNLTIVSSTQITCTVPPGTAGATSVIVAVVGATSASKPYTYITPPPTINNPTITSISPSCGSTTGGQFMTIIGTNLLNATVTIGGNPVKNLTIVSSTQITCTVPPGTAGPTSVIVAVAGAISASKPYTYNEIVISDICFPAGTPITTDQGYIPIEQINPEIHTIHNSRIVAITKTITHDKYLVCFEKHSLGPNIPNKKTITSKNHKVYYNGAMIKAYLFLKHFKYVSPVKYNGEILYNVLMEKHDKLKVNNIIFETLDPENLIAKLYTSNFDDGYKNKLAVMINYCIMQKDRGLYRAIINRILHDKLLTPELKKIRIRTRQTIINCTKAKKPVINRANFNTKSLIRAFKM